MTGPGPPACGAPPGMSDEWVPGHGPTSGCPSFAMSDEEALRLSMATSDGASSPYAGWGVSPAPSVEDGPRGRRDSVRRLSQAVDAERKAAQEAVSDREDHARLSGVLAERLDEVTREIAALSPDDRPARRPEVNQGSERGTRHATFGEAPETVALSPRAPDGEELEMAASLVQQRTTEHGRQRKVTIVRTPLQLSSPSGEEEGGEVERQADAGMLLERVPSKQQGPALGLCELATTKSGLDAEHPVLALFRCIANAVVTVECHAPEKGADYTERNRHVPGDVVPVFEFVDMGTERAGKPWVRAQTETGWISLHASTGVTLFKEVDMPRHASMSGRGISTSSSTPSDEMNEVSLAMGPPPLPPAGLVGVGCLARPSPPPRARARASCASH